jgi:glycosyltransferase involved in cell wall biosynthesis
VLGRNSDNAEPSLRRALEGCGVPFATLGILPAEQIMQILSSADVLLFVRGSLGNTRGSAIAAIACGLPIVGYLGPETKFPITEAGLELVPEGDRDGLAVALSRLLGDESLRHELSQRSVRAYERYFSWDRIAEQYETVLGK